MSVSDTYPAAVKAPPIEESRSPAAAALPGVAARRAARLRAVVIDTHGLVWRMLRRFGASAARIDEGVSQVFDVLARRLDDVAPGKEQAFLIQVCARVASELRRGDARRARIEALGAAEAAIVVPSPEEIFEQHEARVLLDEVLAAMDDDVRAVFVLHEIEQSTAVKIAESLGIPQGTVASRLRRGRAQFEQAATQLRRRLGVSGKGGER